MVMRTLRWLYVADADTVTVSSSTLAASASSAPRTLGTSAARVTPSGAPTASTTSAAPAIAGTAVGLTNAATSRCVTPAVSNASIRSTRWSTVSGASACSPSRAPTSRMVMTAGNSLMAVTLRPLP